MFGVTSLKQEAWKAQVHLVDQAQRVFCCSCIPTSFSSGSLTAWRAVERFYAENFGFLFDNTSLCCLCLHLSSLNFCHLITAVVVIIFGLDCFINSVLAYDHITNIHCLIIGLNQYFVIWGSKRSRCFTRYLNIQFTIICIS